jgi:predicted dehydrogenase
MNSLDATMDTQLPIVTAQELAEQIRDFDFSDCSATIIGYGNMGKQYLNALQSLGIGQVIVCSRSQAPMEELVDVANVTILAGGFQELDVSTASKHLAIVATPTADLAPASMHLADLGFEKILIEKPISFRSAEIESLNSHLNNRGTAAFCAYNRLAYPTLIEARSRAAEEGGITSCVYSFTEIFLDELEQNHPADELAHWGVANSLHPISMAHALIGLPMTWSGHRSGGLPWHPSGSVFVGSGVSEQDIPFSYQADWGSKGRWSVEINTEESSYRLCPLEKLFSKKSSLSDWEEMPVAVYDSSTKPGVVEQLAAMIVPDIGRAVQLMDLTQTTRLTAFGEDVFGYSA